MTDEFIDCIQPSDYGYFGALDGATASPGGGTAAGFVEAGSAGSIFPATPADGSLIFAIASGYSWTGAMPASGTISGFGATWDLIYTEAYSQQGSAAFVEVYRAQQATYATPDRLRYDFPAGAVGDGRYYAVGFISLLNTDPAGLTDNGESGTRNVTTHGVTLSTFASYSQPTPYRDAASLTFTAAWRFAFQNEGNAGTSDFVISDPDLIWPNGVVDAPMIGSGRGGVVAAPDHRTGGPSWTENAFLYLSPDITFNWQATYVRPWWALTLEVLSDPACVGIPAYWGILATPA